MSKRSPFAIFLARIKEILAVSLIIGFALYTLFQTQRFVRAYWKSSAQYRKMEDELYITRVNKILMERKIEYLRSEEGKKRMLFRSGFAPKDCKIYKIQTVEKGTP